MLDIVSGTTNNHQAGCGNKMFERNKFSGGQELPSTFMGTTLAKNGSSLSI
jgi:hypothetical protein